MKAYLRFGILAAMVVVVAGCGFATSGYSTYDPPGFLYGVWHGLLAPWSLVFRLFLDIKTYAFPNGGWFYDLGFVIGVLLSLFPPGWIALVIALVVYILT